MMSALWSAYSRGCRSEHREVLMLQEIDEMSYREIATTWPCRLVQ